MLEQKLKKKELGFFNYKKTAWYQSIREEGRSFKLKLLFFSVVAALFVLVLLYLSDFAAGRPNRFPAFAIPFGLLSLFLVALARFRRVRALILVALVFLAVGFFAVVFLPGSSESYLIIFAVFSPFAMQLRGRVRGSIWSACFFVAIVASYLLQLAGIGPSWTVRPEPVTIATFVGIGAILFVLSYHVERRQEAMIDRLTNLLIFDETTGLPNKDVLEHSIDANRRYIFAIIKIENFSDLVALFGYEFSDTISQFASRKLRKYEERLGFRVFQLKFNEWGVLSERIVQPTVAEAAQLISDLLKALESETLPWESDRIRLVYRIGGTIVCPGDDRSPFSKADIALKKAERGHSSFTIFDDDKVERRNAYESVMKFSELISNRENGTFKAVFQPVFDALGSKVEWYEALLRLKVQDGSYVSVYPYLEVAKSTGFYQYLTEFIMRKTAEAIVEHDVDVSINISINDIVRPDFIMLVDEVYETIREKRGRIIFEILESDELVELEKCIWFIDYITRYGFKIAIDDFGTGYSNYCTLVNLPIDIVKIDGSLITRIKSDENARTLVEGIVLFCKKANKKTVAEYVEDEHVFQSVKRLEIDFLQGYYLAKPASISEFVDAT